MSSTNLIIGLALGVLLGGLIIVFRHRYRDVFATILVFGVIVLAVAVTILRIDQYQEQKATPVAEAQLAAPDAAPAGPPPKPPIGLAPAADGPRPDRRRRAGGGREPLCRRCQVSPHRPV